MATYEKEGNSLIKKETVEVKEKYSREQLQQYIAVLEADLNKYRTLLIECDKLNL